jgi:hypothetical protein
MEQRNEKLNQLRVIYFEGGKMLLILILLNGLNLKIWLEKMLMKKKSDRYNTNWIDMKIRYCKT